MRTWVLPFVAVCVAVMQMLASSQLGLSPWKGGGFGMFASTDSPGNRRLVIRAVDERGSEYLVRLPSGRMPGVLGSRTRMRAVTYPTRSRLMRIAMAVLTSDLRTSSTQTSEIPDHLQQSIYGSALKDLAVTRAALDVVGSSPRSGSFTSNIRVVSVEVLRLQFDPHARVVGIARLEGMTVTAARSPR